MVIRIASDGRLENRGSPPLGRPAGPGRGLPTVNTQEIDCTVSHSDSLEPIAVDITLGWIDPVLANWAGRPDTRVVPVLRAQ